MVASAAAVVTMVTVTASCSLVAPPDLAVPATQQAADPSAPTSTSKIQKAPAVDPEWPRWGFTHTKVSANDGTSRFERSVSRTLARTPMLQNQHIMGFGALNPQPRPREFHWESLDGRTDLMKRSEGTQIITLCCAPDWMKGGPEGPTPDWAWDDHLEDAPYPQHFDDFAKLSATIAAKYRDVKYFMVWNEFKGFWKDHSEPADFKGYTELYNKVYDAVKAVRPDAKIGGPYLGFDSNKTGASELRGTWGVVNQHVLDAFNHWFENKRGADFIVVDGASLTDAHELLPDAFGALGKFSEVTTWLRERTGDLPVWWSEWYFVPEDGTKWPEPMRLAVQAASMIEFAESGAATALYWNPQAESGACRACMWNPRTGAALPTGKLVADFVTWFPAGAELEHVTSSDPKVRVLAQPRRLLMVNTADEKITTTVDGRTFTLRPYEIKWSDR